MLDLGGLLGTIPKPVAISIACIVIGGAGTFAHEVRYMTVADFTKSYILDLKREIRENRNDLADTNDPAARRIIQEIIDMLVDELCFEVPNDPYCKDR